MTEKTKQGLMDIGVSGIRKYTVEYALLALASCVVYLFLNISSLNSYIRGELMRQNEKVIQVVDKNNTVINDFLQYEKDKK